MMSPRPVGSRGSPGKEYQGMRLVARLAKVFMWGLVMILVILAGAAWFAYALVTDSETAARLTKAHVARFLPHSLIDLGRVSPKLLSGEVTVTQVMVRQRIDGESFLTTRIPWLSVKLDPRQLLHGKFEAREVVITHMTLRLRRRKDG